MKKLILSTILSIIFTFTNVAFADTNTYYGSTGATPYYYTANSVTWNNQNNNGDITRPAWNYKVLPAISGGENISFKLGVKYNAIDDTTGEPLIPQPTSCPDGTGGNDLNIALIPMTGLNTTDFTFYETGGNVVGVTHKYKAYGNGTYNQFTGGCEYNMYSIDNSSGTGDIPPEEIIAGNYLAILQDHAIINEDNITTWFLRGSNTPSIETRVAGEQYIDNHSFLVAPDNGDQILNNLDFYINSIDSGSGGGGETGSICNPFSTNISNAFLNPEFSVSGCINGIITWAFVPSDSVLNSFSNLTLENSIPFSYLYDMPVLYDEAFNHTATSFNIAIAFGSFGDITLLSSSKLQSVPFQGTVRTILGAIMIFMTAMLLYGKVIGIHDPNHETGDSRAWHGVNPKDI